MPELTTPTPATVVQELRDLRERMAKMEQHVAALTLVSSSSGAAANGWRGLIGTFADDPMYDEVVRLGRAYRESERPQGDEA